MIMRIWTKTSWMVAGLFLACAAPASAGLSPFGAAADDPMLSARFALSTDDLSALRSPVRTTGTSLDVLAGRRLDVADGPAMEPSDAPAVRKIVDDAAEKDYRFSELILGIVRSAPFRMREVL